MQVPRINIATIQKRRTATPLFRSKAVGSSDGKLACFAPIFDKNIGCGASDQKVSCISKYLSAAMNCFFFGDGDPKYFISRNDELLSCENRDNYTRSQMLDLMGCANSNGKVLNNTCTTEEGFCDCNRVIGQDKYGNPTRVHKEWNAYDRQCSCNQSSAYPAKSIDGKCCIPQATSCSEDHQYYDCDTGECQCTYPYRKITIEGHPDSGKCFFSCNIETQNNPRNSFDPDKGYAGCGAPGNGQLWGGKFYFGQSDDLCCGPNGICTLDDDPTSMKSQCLANDNLWVIDIAKANTCPRKGSCQLPACGYDEGGYYPTFTSSCNVNVNGTGLLVPKASRKSCRSWCESKCNSVAEDGSKSFIDSYDVIGGNNCQCSCKDTPPSAL